MYNMLWSEYVGHAESLAKSLKEQDINVGSVYGIPRGGILLAFLLSHSLNVPLLVDENLVVMNTLVVDDIADSGSTLKRFWEKHWTNMGQFTAVMVLNQKSTFYPTFHVVYNRTNEWIKFPYEREVDTVSSVLKESYTAGL